MNDNCTSSLVTQRNHNDVEMMLMAPQKVHQKQPIISTNNNIISSSTSANHLQSTTPSSSSSSMLSDLLRKPMLTTKTSTTTPPPPGTSSSKNCEATTMNDMLVSTNCGEESSTSPGTIVRSPDELICSNSNHIDDYILESQTIGLVFENTAKLLPQMEINNMSSTTALTSERTDISHHNQVIGETPWMSYFDSGMICPSENYKTLGTISTTALTSATTDTINGQSHHHSQQKTVNERPIHRTNSLPLANTTDNICLKMAADSTEYTTQIDKYGGNYLHQTTGYELPPSSVKSQQNNKKKLAKSHQPQQGLFVNSQNGLRQGQHNVYQTPCHPSQSPWCSIFYYELNVRIGDAFHSDASQIVIDGFTEPCYKSDRFSLGSLSNVNRSLQILSTRPHIGRGVRLIKTPTEVFIHCLSKSAVFVQSLSCNRYHNWHLATVVKVPSDCKLKVFDKKEFMMLLNQFELENFEAVYSLTHFCLIRLSFVKGWGDDYKRQTVTSTPCWIEIHLNEPLKWLDPILARLGSPKKPCTSTS